MKLPIFQIDRFYDLWLPLLEFVNLQTATLSQEEMDHVLENEDPESESQLRTALWKNPWVLDKFIKLNPAKYNSEDLATVSEWRQFKYGDFTLLKVVRGLGIFGSHEEPHEIYSVYPLYSEFRDLLPEIPTLVQTAIIPYGNVLVYDGSMVSYSIHFGPGIRKMTENWYIDAKERDLIRTSFESNPPLNWEEKLSQVERTDSSVLLYFKKYLKHENFSDKIIQRDIKTAEIFAQYLTHAQKSPLSLRDVSVKVLSQFMSSDETRTEQSTMVGIRRLIQFLSDSDRIDWDLGKELLLELQSFRR
jgi:hypothetical protein